MKHTTLLLSLTVIALVLVLFGRGLSQDEAGHIAAVLLILGLPLVPLGVISAVLYTYVYVRKRDADSRYQDVSTYIQQQAQRIAAQQKPQPALSDDEPREFGQGESEEILKKLEEVSQ